MGEALVEDARLLVDQPLQIGVLLGALGNRCVVDLDHALVVGPVGRGRRLDQIGLDLVALGDQVVDLFFAFGQLLRVLLDDLLVMDNAPPQLLALVAIAELFDLRERRRRVDRLLGVRDIGLRRRAAGFGRRRSDRRPLARRATGITTIGGAPSSVFGASVGLSRLVESSFGLSASFGVPDGVGLGVTTFFDSIVSVPVGEGVGVATFFDSIVSVLVGEGVGATPSDFGFESTFAAPVVTA